LSYIYIDADPDDFFAGLRKESTFLSLKKSRWWDLAAFRECCQEALAETWP